MASEGPLSAGAGADDATVGTVLWGQAGRIVTSDNLKTLASVAGTTHYLVSSAHGFAIPTTATVDGIVAEFERNTTGAVADSRVRIVKGGAIGATERSAGAAWAVADQYDSFGSSSDKWGETWTPADINASNFGVALSAVVASGFAQVDHVRITVYYTPADPGVVKNMTLLGVG